MPITIDCFKAYDVRGQIPDQLNADVCYRIGNATAAFLDATSVVVGRDMRLSSDEFAEAVTRGLVEAGVDVLDIGLCGTEMVYFATSFLNASGGGLADIRRLAEQDERRIGDKPGDVHRPDVFDDYIRHIVSYVDVDKLKPLKLVVNAGNGCAGIAIDGLEKYLPFEFIKVHHEPDGSFPNGIPNPLLPENRAATIGAVRANGADMGIAWDGDFDRCFLFDESGGFIEGYYIVGLLAESILKKAPGANIVHDPRLTWNTLDIVAHAGGKAVQSKSGHSFIKEKMREVDGVYGGEMSAHHYFREFSYADSGMIPWLLVAELVCQTGKSLSDLVGKQQAMYPASGEINRKVTDAPAALEALYVHYSDLALSVDDTDGYSFEFPDWRFNIRMSNTEPVVRLNVESRGDHALMKAKTQEVLDILQGD
jgi:phosphomannomutase